MKCHRCQSENPPGMRFCGQCAACTFYLFVQSIRAQILNLLKRLQDKLGLAYVMISHDLAAARYRATRLAVMYGGKLVETGDCEAVYTEPLHPYTEALLSAALPLHPGARGNGSCSRAKCRIRRIRLRAVASTRAVRARCRSGIKEPEWREIKPGRLTSCHLY